MRRTRIRLSGPKRWSALLLCLACWSSASAADPDWYLIYAAGKKPDRRVYLAREFVINPSATPALDAVTKGATPGTGPAAEVWEVFEAKNGPDSIAHTLQFKCDANVAKSKWRYTRYRDDRRDQQREQAWTPIEAKWLERARQFACMPSNERTEANQIASLGEVDGSELTDLVWASFWKDGVRPAYTSTRTAEERQADTEQQLSQAYNDLMTNVRDPLLRQQAENRRMARNAARRGPRHSVAASWVGARDTELFARWGNPARDSGVSADRDVSYHYENSSVTRMMQGGAITGENWVHQYCDIGFNIYEGQVKDYWTEGHRDLCLALELPVRR